MAPATLSTLSSVSPNNSPRSNKRANTNGASGDDCRRCGRDVTRLDMVRHGLELQFVSCSDCDVREWMRNGEVVDLDSLLSEMVATREADQAIQQEANEAAEVAAKQSSASTPARPIVVSEEAAEVSPTVFAAPTMVAPRQPVTYSELIRDTDPDLVADVAMRFVA